MPYHWLDFTPPQPQIAAAPVEDFVTAASTCSAIRLLAMLEIALSSIIQREIQEPAYRRPCQE